MPDEERNAAAEETAEMPVAVAEEAKEPSKPKPEQKPLAITARQFIKAKGLRWERSAGFLHFASAKYGVNHRMAVVKWGRIWDAWWQQPAEQPVSREEV